MFSRAQQGIILTAIKANSLELALYSTNPTASDVGTEVVGGGYSRKSITFGTNTVVSDGTQISNTGVVTFTQASNDWTTATHWGLRIVGGALVTYGTLSQGGVATSRTIRTGDIYQQAIGSVVIKVGD